MSHNLTQPEEIDRILMTMADHDTEAGAPIPDGAQSRGTIVRDAERDEFATVAGLSYGSA